MPKQDYYQQGQLTDLAYLVLVSLSKPSHGYLIMAKIDSLTNGGVSIGPASLYTTLKKLTSVGFISLIADSDNKKVYCITEEGFNTLRVEIEKRERYASYGRLALNEYKEGNYEQI